MTDASPPDSPITGPSIKRCPGLPDLMKYYPPDAERQGIEGMVDIQVTLGAQSHVTDTLIREAHPANMGFPQKRRKSNRGSQTSLIRVWDPLLHAKQELPLSTYCGGTTM